MKTLKKLLKTKLAKEKEKKGLKSDRKNQIKIKFGKKSKLSQTKLGLNST
jgi:hypothetical protein